MRQERCDYLRVFIHAALANVGVRRNPFDMRGKPLIQRVKHAQRFQQAKRDQRQKFVDLQRAIRGGLCDHAVIGLNLHRHRHRGFQHDRVDFAGHDGRADLTARQRDFPQKMEQTQVLTHFQQIGGVGVQHAGDFDETIRIGGGVHDLFCPRQAKPGDVAQPLDA